MFKDFTVWLLALDDGSIVVYIEQYGRVYEIPFASAAALRTLLKPCNEFVDALYPELSQNIIAEINKIP